MLLQASHITYCKGNSATLNCVDLPRKWFVIIDDFPSGKFWD